MDGQVAFLPSSTTPTADVGSHGGAPTAARATTLVSVSDPWRLDYTLHRAVSVIASLGQWLVESVRRLCLNALSTELPRALACALTMGGRVVDRRASDG